MSARARKTTGLAYAAMLAAALASCDGGGGGKDPEATGAKPDAAGPPPAPEADAGAGGAPGPDAEAPPVEEASQALRTAGRMRVEQIRRSLETITGGLRWEEDFGQGPTDMLRILGPTMGEPDYLLVTEENLEPSLIIAKFMQDASHRVCTRWLDRDAAADAGERTFVHHAEAWTSTAAADVDASLRGLMLRFFARYLPPDGSGDAAIADLRELFVNASSTATAGSEARDGWLAVCIALMTDPEFVVY